jgi:Bacterial SH3 domain.
MKKIINFLGVLAVLSMACNQSVPSSNLPTVPQNLPTVQELPTVSEVLPTVGDNSADGFTAQISSPVVNVRNGPGGAVIGSLQSGTAVQVVQCSGDWCEISKPIRGFIFMGCLDVETDLGCKAK